MVYNLHQLKMIIYKTTNLVNGKIYIGKACGRNATNNYLGSGLLIKRAINRYGKERFKRVIVDVCESRKDQNNKEAFWIKFYNAQNKCIGYNIADGGQGGNTTLNHLDCKTIYLKIALKAKERYKDKQKHPMYGTKHSEVARLKISKGLIGRTPWNKGKVGLQFHSEETRRKMSEAHCHV